MKFIKRFNDPHYPKYKKILIVVLTSMITFLIWWAVWGGGALIIPNHPGGKIGGDIMMFKD